MSEVNADADRIRGKLGGADVEALDRIMAFLGEVEQANSALGVQVSVPADVREEVAAMMAAKDARIAELEAENALLRGSS